MQAIETARLLALCGVQRHVNTLVGAIGITGILAITRGVS